MLGLCVGIIIYLYVCVCVKKCNLLNSGYTQIVAADFLSLSAGRHFADAVIFCSFHHINYLIEWLSLNPLPDQVPQGLGNHSQRKL